MKVLLFNQDFGLWGKKGKYSLANNSLAENVVKKGVAKEVLNVTQDEIGMLILNWKLNTIPECVVEELTKIKISDITYGSEKWCEEYNESKNR